VVPTPKRGNHQRITHGREFAGELQRFVHPRHHLTQPAPALRERAPFCLLRVAVLTATEGDRERLAAPVYGDDMRSPLPATPVTAHHWRAVRLVHGEAVVLLGEGRALLMQLAHPAVAAGVAEHSRYRSDRLGSLLGTLRPMFAITFGTAAQAEAAAASIRVTHEGVRGAGYRASDPALL